MSKTIQIKQKALDYATKAHEGQVRKGSDIPYITHPTAVANILMNKGFGVDVIVGALLHDVVEDCPGYSLSDIEKEFGTIISKIVDYVSEVDKSLSWKERKVDYINRLKEGPYEAVVVSAADKLHNLYSTVEAYRENGEAVWKMFNSKKDGQFWFYSSLSEIYRENGLIEFADEIDEMLVEVNLAL